MKAFEGFVMVEVENGRSILGLYPAIDSRCKKYLNTLEAMQSAWVEAGFDVVAVSADSREKARMDVAEFGWTFPVACELAESDMKKLGVYISDPLSPDEADGRFAEPAVFVLRPDGAVQIAAISNGPSARPELAELLDGMVFTIKKNDPSKTQNCQIAGLTYG